MASFFSKPKDNSAQIRAEQERQRAEIEKRDKEAQDKIDARDKSRRAGRGTRSLLAAPAGSLPNSGLSRNLGTASA